jgi:predicted nucleotidyltransferase
VEKRGILIEPEIFTKIKNQLFQLEMEEDVKVLYACESGSRAWGFPSADSDYDIRLIYLRKPAWYLSIDPGRDVIEWEIKNGIDLSGWDLKKALPLFRKSNPPLIEWLGSPIVYLEQYSIVQQMRDLLNYYFSPTASMYHYLHMVENTKSTYLNRNMINTKKYFYALRPLLACMWLEQERGPVPTEFQRLVDTIITDRQLKESICELIETKKSGKEMSSGSRIPEISEFIEFHFDRLNGKNFDLVKNDGITEELDSLFRSALREVWGPEF